MYFYSVIMCSSDNKFNNKAIGYLSLDKIIGICTNKLHNVESAFVTSSIGYRAKNDPGD